MDRRAFFAAAGGLLVSTIFAKAQDLPLVGDAFDLGGDALGAGLAAPSQILGDGAGGGFRLADLMGGEFAIETSKLALERSRHTGVRQFAQLEIAEQTSVAAALGAAPGSVSPRPDQLAIVNRLASMRSGAAFDHAYIMGQIKGHRELLSVNRQAIQSADEPAVRRVATVAVPTIETHLAILSRLRAGAQTV